MTPDILPTHSCFDDVIAYFAAAAVPSEDWHRHRIVHAVCREGDVLYAHAWVEVDRAVVWQGGIERATGELVFFALPLERFGELYGVQESSRYTVPAFFELMKQTDHSGPWRPAVRALCSDISGDTGPRVIGMVAELGAVPVLRQRRKRGAS